MGVGSASTGSLDRGNALPGAPEGGNQVPARGAGRAWARRSARWGRSGWLQTRSRLMPVCLAVMASAALLGPLASAARASTVLSQGWESGLGGWTVVGDFWHVQTHPEAISVKSPDINP